MVAVVLVAAVAAVYASLAAAAALATVLAVVLAAVLAAALSAVLPPPSDSERLTELIAAIGVMSDVTDCGSCLVTFAADGRRRIPLLVSRRVHCPSLLEDLKERGDVIRPDATVEELQKAEDDDDHRPVLLDDRLRHAFSSDTRFEFTLIRYQTQGLVVWEDHPHHAEREVARHILSLTDGRLPIIRTFDFNFHVARGAIVSIDALRGEPDSIGLDGDGLVIAELHLRYIAPSHPALLAAERARGTSKWSTLHDDCAWWSERGDEAKAALRDALRSDLAARAIQRAWRRVLPRVRAARTIRKAFLQNADDIRMRLYAPPTGAMYKRVAHRYTSNF